MRNWIPLGLMALLLVLCLALTEFSLKVETTLLKVAGTAALFTAVAHYAASRNVAARLSFTLSSIAQMGLLFLLATRLIGDWSTRPRAPLVAHVASAAVT